MNWRGRTLQTIKTLVQCIANTRTGTGLTVVASLDTETYPVGISVDPATLAQLN